MSFVRTLATLAAGFAAAKGYDKYRQMGGLPGVSEAMKANPALARMQEQFARLGGRGTVGVPGGAGGADAGGPLAGLIGAMGGAAASGATGIAALMDAMTGTTAASTAIENNAKLMIRAMIQAARADGVIDPQERARLEAHLTDLSPEELEFVRTELEAPVDPVALARDAGEGVRDQVYASAASMIRGDSDQEAQFLATLANAMGIEAAHLASIHEAIGTPPPKL